MKKLILFLLLLTPFPVWAQATAALPIQSCVQGATQASVSGIKSTNFLQGVVPYCSVTVYLTGTTTKALIYADTHNTPLPNPFAASSTGTFLVYTATNVGVDVVLSGGIPPNAYGFPLTITGIYPGTNVQVGTVCSPNVLTAGCTGGNDQPSAFASIFGPGGTITGPLVSTSSISAASITGVTGNFQTLNVPSPGAITGGLIDSVATLSAYTSAHMAQASSVRVAGYNTGSTLGAGTFQWVPPSTVTVTSVEETLCLDPDRAEILAKFGLDLGPPPFCVIYTYTGGPIKAGPWEQVTVTGTAGGAFDVDRKLIVQSGPGTFTILASLSGPAISPHSDTGVATVTFKPDACINIAPSDDAGPTGNLGVMQRIISDFVYPEMCGARADGAADDTSALQAWAAVPWKRSMSKSVYTVSGTINMNGELGPLIGNPYYPYWGVEAPTGSQILETADNVPIMTIYGNRNRYVLPWLNYKNNQPSGNWSAIGLMMETYPGLGGIYMSDQISMRVDNANVGFLAGPFQFTGTLGATTAQGSNVLTMNTASAQTNGEGNMPWAKGQYVQVQMDSVPAAGSTNWLITRITDIGPSSTPSCIFTATIGTAGVASTALTVNSVTSGTVGVGQLVVGVGVAPNTHIVSGLAPNWVVDTPQLVGASTPMTTSLLTVITLADALPAQASSGKSVVHGNNRQANGSSAAPAIYTNFSNTYTFTRIVNPSYVGVMDRGGGTQNAWVNLYIDGGFPAGWVNPDGVSTSATVQNGLYFPARQQDWFGIVNIEHLTCLGSCWSFGGTTGSVVIGSMHFEGDRLKTPNTALVEMSNNGAVIGDVGVSYCVMLADDIDPTHTGAGAVGIFGTKMTLFNSVNLYGGGRSKWTVGTLSTAKNMVNGTGNDTIKPVAFLVRNSSTSTNVEIGYWAMLRDGGFFPIGPTVSSVNGAAPRILSLMPANTAQYLFHAHLYDATNQRMNYTAGLNLLIKAFSTNGTFYNGTVATSGALWQDSSATKLLTTANNLDLNAYGSASGTQGKVTQIPLDPAVTSGISYGSAPNALNPSAFGQTMFFKNASFLNTPVVVGNVTSSWVTGRAAGNNQTNLAFINLSQAPASNTYQGWIAGTVLYPPTQANNTSPTGGALVTGTPLMVGNTITGTGIAASTHVISAATSNYNASIASSTLTVNSVPNGTIAVGDTITGQNIAANTHIVSGSGQTVGSTWTVDTPQTAANFIVRGVNYQVDVSQTVGSQGSPIAITGSTPFVAGQDVFITGSVNPGLSGTGGDGGTTGGIVHAIVVDATNVLQPVFYVDSPTCTIHPGNLTPGCGTNASGGALPDTGLTITVKPVVDVFILGDNL